MRSLITFLRGVKKTVDKNGFIQKDIRMNRYVKALPGHFEVLKGRAFQELKFAGIPDKYVQDFTRMHETFLAAALKAKKDRYSRQLVVLNTDNYLEVQPCFLSMQFVYTHRSEFDLYVYQRSSDLSKLRDDLAFFAHVAKEFEVAVKCHVTKLVVVFGNIHYEVSTP